MYSMGAAWVGAHHLLGNVAEWVTTLFAREPILSPAGSSSVVYSYRYDRADGRADRDNIYAPRVVRGGSLRTASDQLSAAWRDYAPPSTEDVAIGFRCVRPY